jgi:uncharacterized membrane protein YjjB (DUF3815 family)
MIVVPFIALCFSAPVAMILCLGWLAATGHTDLALLPKEAGILIATTALISLALAVLARPPRR